MIHRGWCDRPLAPSRDPGLCDQGWGLLGTEEYDRSLSTSGCSVFFHHKDVNETLHAVKVIYANMNTTYFC